MFYVHNINNPGFPQYTFSLFNKTIHDVLEDSRAYDIGQLWSNFSIHPASAQWSDNLLYTANGEPLGLQEQQKIIMNIKYWFKNTEKINICIIVSWSAKTWNNPAFTKFHIIEYLLSTYITEVVCK